MRGGEEKQEKRAGVLKIQAGNFFRGKERRGGGEGKEARCGLGAEMLKRRRQMDIVDKSTDSFQNNWMERGKV